VEVQGSLRVVPDRVDEIIHIRVLCNDMCRLLDAPHHPVKRSILGPLYGDHDLLLILVGKETLGNGPEEIYSDKHRGDRGRERGKAVLHHQGKSSFIKVEHRVKYALEKQVEAAMFFPSLVAQELAAEHGGERQRNKPGYKDGHRDGDGKLVEQSPQHPCHKEHRDEDGSQ